MTVTRRLHIQLVRRSGGSRTTFRPFFLPNSLTGRQPGERSALSEPTPRANRFRRRTSLCRQPPKAASPGWPPWAQYGPGAGGHLAYQPYSRVSVSGWSTRSNTMSRVACAKRAIIPAAHRVHSDHSLASLEDVWHTQEQAFDAISRVQRQHGLDWRESI